MKAYYKVLGCKMNFLESEKIAGSLSELGVGIATSEKEARTIIVNTCAVTNRAEQKSRQAIRSLHVKNPEAEIIAFGCAVKASPQIFENLKELHYAFKEWDEVIKHIQRGIPKLRVLPSFKQMRTRVYIEIQNGCDNYCTYCIIARLRGKHRSRSTREIVQDIRQAQLKGVKEIVLTGINLGAWGAKNSNLHRQNKFAELLKIILKETTVPRVRISSLNPQFLTDDVLKVWSTEKRIMPHLHLSLQSGSSTVLQRMRRGYGKNDVDESLATMRKLIPHLGISADVITGFCDETEKEFQETCEFVEKHEFLKCHVFPFSLRQGTLAQKMGDTVPFEIKKERAAKLRKLSDALHKKFVTRHTGFTTTVLVEAEKNNTQKGLTENGIEVTLPTKKYAHNSIVRHIINSDVIRSRGSALPVLNL